MPGRCQWRRLSRFCADSLRNRITSSGPATFPSLIVQLFDDHHILGPNQIADVYLLALAVKNGGRLVTFDRGLPLRAVRGAQAQHLVVL